MRRLELATCLFSLCIQTVLWARTASSLDGRGHAHQAAQVALQAASLALSLCLPSVAYRQYRWVKHGAGCPTPVPALARASDLLVPAGPTWHAGCG